MRAWYIDDYDGMLIYDTPSGKYFHEIDIPKELYDKFYETREAHETCQDLIRAFPIINKGKA